MFCLREKVVYLGHGVAEISSIIEKNVGGKATEFFELRLIHDKTIVLIPTTNLKGIRKLISKDEIEQTVFKMLSDFPVKTDNDGDFKVAVTTSSWAKRNRQYQNEICSGDIIKLIKIYKILKSRSLDRNLSFGEKGLLEQAEFLLAQEISLVEGIDEQAARKQLCSFFPCASICSPQAIKPASKSSI